MIDAAQSPELTAAIIAVKRSQRELRNGINRLARSRMTPIWRSTLQGFGSQRRASIVLQKGARGEVGARSVRLVAATSTRALSGGLIPTYEWAGDEYGMTPKVRTFDTHSPKGTPYRVTKTVGRQYPKRQKKGRVVGPAAGDATRALVGLWVQTVVDGFREFAEITGK
jgi:hypothetical protein